MISSTYKKEKALEINKNIMENIGKTDNIERLIGIPIFANAPPPPVETTATSSGRPATASSSANPQTDDDMLSEMLEQKMTMGPSKKRKAEHGEVNVYFNLPKQGMKTLNRIKQAIYSENLDESMTQQYINILKNYVDSKEIR